MRRLASAVLPAALAACSFDWSTTPSAPDATTAQDAAVMKDASVTSDAAVPDAGLSCVALADALHTARLAAKRCTSIAGACTATTTDECGCTITIAATSSPQTAAYKSALASFQSAQCTPSCAAQCLAPQPGLCVVASDFLTYCMPQ